MDDPQFRSWRSGLILRLAALPMYDFEELRTAHDALWSAIAARLQACGVAAPDILTRDMAVDAIWTHPALLLAQTCGYPLVTSLRGRVGLVATPCYNAPGCEGPFYRSAVVVRNADRAACLADLRGCICAVNDIASNSGMNLLRAAIAPLAGKAEFFGDVVITGSHLASMRAVASGAADMAAIDCLSWAYTHDARRAETADLRVVAWTPPSPGLPIITASGTDAATSSLLLRVLHEVAGDARLERVLGTLRLSGFRSMQLDDYDTVLGLERKAILAGYPQLR